MQVPDFILKTDLFHSFVKPGVWNHFPKIGYERILAFLGLSYPQFGCIWFGKVEEEGAVCVWWSAVESVQCSGNRIAMGIGWHHLANGAVVCLCLAGMMEIGEAGSHLPFFGSFWVPHICGWSKTCSVDLVKCYLRVPLLLFWTVLQLKYWPTSLWSSQKTSVRPDIRRLSLILPRISVRSNATENI